MRVRPPFSSHTLSSCIAAVKAEDELDIDGTVEEDLGKSRDGSKTDDEVVQRYVYIVSHYVCTLCFK